MVQETDRIKDHIDSKRAKLEQDLYEIEHRVSKAVDWREWFDRNPAGMLGAAAAGGFVLSLLLRRSPDATHDNRFAELDSSTTAAGVSKARDTGKTWSQMDRLSETFDNTVAALLGLASRKVRDFVAGAVPNFREEYSAVEAKRAGRQRL